MAEEKSGNGIEGTPDPKQIQIDFEFAPTYRIVPVNGAWGGFTPRGDFKIDFFVEGSGTPDSIIYEVTGTGLGKEIQRNRSKTFVRRIEMSILLSAQQAESIADFIKRTIAAKKAKEQKS